MEVVERAQREAELSGGLLAMPSGRVFGSIDPDARAALARWAATGGYAHALEASVSRRP